MEASFYVTLPSNSLMNVHPNNTLAHFFENLPSTLTLTGEWEVAMAEFIYPHRWLNVFQGDNLIFCSAGTQGPHGHTIAEGYYSTPKELISAFKHPIDHDGQVSLSYNKYIQKIVAKARGARVTFYGRLATLLGFNVNDSIVGLALWTFIHFIANISDGGPIEFVISGSGEDYVDLSQTQLYIKAKVVKADGTNLTDDSSVGPVNLFLQSLFSQIDVTLNERLISASTPTYHYRAMI